MDISKQSTLHLKSVISETKWAYSFDFSVCLLLSWACELKQVDGFCLVVHNHNVVPQSSGGIEPPPAAVRPGKSLLNVNMNVIDEKYGNSHRNTNIRPE